MRLTITTLVVFALVAWLAPRGAAAYPQFQLSLGAERCSTCHISPGGGGLLNAYGRDEAATTISDGGDGRLLHGLWEPPAWIQLGGDVRGAIAGKARTPQTEVLAFPMQMDVYARLGGERIAAMLTVGLRGGARDPQPPLLERLASREHYLLYQRDSGSYVRAGRFFPVLGLRLADHTAYVRRYLGANTLEEPYGIAGGYVGESWEAHLSAFVPRPIDFLGAGLQERGAAAYIERRWLDDTAAVGAQLRVGSASTGARVTAGIVGKRWFPDAEVMLLGELDLVRRSLADDAGPTHYQLAAYGGAQKRIGTRWWAGVAVQRWQPDLRLGTATDAVQLDLQYFPRAHFELHLLTRLAGAGDFERPGLLSLLQVHYYL